MCHKLQVLYHLYSLSVFYSYSQSRIVSILDYRYSLHFYSKIFNTFFDQNQPFRVKKIYIPQLNPFFSTSSRGTFQNTKTRSAIQYIYIYGFLMYILYVFYVILMSQTKYDLYCKKWNLNAKTVKNICFQ